jgi:hypothetical protein
VFQILAVDVNKKSQVADISTKPTSCHLSHFLHYKMSDKDKTFWSHKHQVTEYFISHFQGIQALLLSCKLDLMQELTLHTSTSSHLHKVYTFNTKKHNKSVKG